MRKLWTGRMGGNASEAAEPPGCVAQVCSPRNVKIRPRSVPSPYACSVETAMASQVYRSRKSWEAASLTAAAVAGEVRIWAIRSASCSTLPGSNSSPASVPRRSRRDRRCGRRRPAHPAAIASSATMPNGSYSDGITTHPARWSRSRSSSSGTKPASCTMSPTPSTSICVCSSGRYVPRPAMTQRMPGHACAQPPDRAAASTWKPFSYCTRPHATHERFAGADRAGPTVVPTSPGRRRSGRGGPSRTAARIRRSPRCA